MISFCNVAIVVFLSRGMVDESGEQFVAYFLPTEETLDKRRFEADGTVDQDDVVELVDYFLINLFCFIN